MRDPRLQGRTRAQQRGVAHIGHSTGLMSSLGRDELLSMLETRDVVESERREVGGVLAAEEVGGSSHAESRGEDCPREPSGVAGVSFALATAFATREEIDAAVRDQQPPHQPPDLPQCQASDLSVPKTYKEAMESEHQHLWSDSMEREIHGLLSAGTFSPAS